MVNFFITDDISSYTNQFEYGDVIWLSHLKNRLERTSIGVFAGEGVTVQLQAGNLRYYVSSSSCAIAEAALPMRPRSFRAKPKAMQPLR